MGDGCGGLQNCDLILRFGAGKQTAPYTYIYMDSFRDSTEMGMRRSLESEEFVVTKKQKIIESLELVEEGLTEKAILQQIGDNRYSREIVRKLLQDHPKSAAKWGHFSRWKGSKHAAEMHTFFVASNKRAGWSEKSIQVASPYRLIVIIRPCKNRT